MTRPRLRLLHETNPQKYFPALYILASKNKVEIVGAHRYSVAKEWLRSWLRDRLRFSIRTRNSFADLLFRCIVPFIRDETILIGFAPWDWRLLIYRQLAKQNRILYHTSWHDWSFENTPRQPGALWFRRYMQRRWHMFLHHQNVTIIAVTLTVAQAIKRETGIDAVVIPHSVPKEFFNARTDRIVNKKGVLQLIYVGEVSEKKGIHVLLKLMKELHSEHISLTVVGNGPLVPQVKMAALHGVKYLGAIDDRAQLAKVMAEHDVLMLLSQKTDAWEELFGIVIIEALATGLAVIASDHVGPKGILAPANGVGLFTEDDYAGVRDLLLGFLQEEMQLTNLVNTQGQIAKYYTAQIVSDMWEREIAS